MKKIFYLFTFLVALTTAVALAQTSSGQSSSGPAWGPPGPASQQTSTTKPTVDDATLDSQVKQQLASDPTMKNVQATVSNGAVDLQGTVASKADKKKAKQMVASIPGVRKVHDHLTVNANATAAPGSNEPTTASAGATGTTSASTSGTTAGSVAGNAGASGTTPQTPTTSAGNTASATGGSSTAANGMPQSDVTPGANAGASAATPQTPSSSTTAASTAPQSSTSGTSGTSGSISATAPPQSSATSGTAATGSTTPTTPQSPATGTSAAGTSTLPQSSAEPGVTAATNPQSATGTQTTTPGETSATPQQSAAASLGDLQHQINLALRHEPVLANDHLNAIVSGDQIVIMGPVANGKERQTALRIAQSFAGNRRVVDRMTVAGGPGAGNQTGVSGTNPGAGANGTNPSSIPTNPTASPESTNNPRR